jgi:hypothetical protein
VGLVSRLWDCEAGSSMCENLWCVS